MLRDELIKELNVMMKKQELASCEARGEEIKKVLKKLGIITGE
jgi:hypothetical protein